MSNGILQTALTKVPLELEYRRHGASNEAPATSEPETHRVSLSRLSGAMRGNTGREEFEQLLSVI